MTYREAGVDTKEGERAVDLMKRHVKKTFGPEVLTGLGAFGSLFQPDLRGIDTPVLVAGADGVGTKLKVAILMDRHDTIGQDLVAMCVNDVLCQGAKPLFFLDYIATGKVSAEKVAMIVKGVADGCALSGCALVGGETAEMPGLYAEDDYDMAGFCVGLVDKRNIIDGSGVREGDMLVGLPSSGVHSNGYSLVRRLFFERLGVGVHDRVDGLSKTLGEELLTPTKIYVRQTQAVLERVRPQAIVHITGGGFFENIPRVLPDGLGARVHRDSWEAPPIFKIIQREGDMSDADIYATLNMGIGLIFVVREGDCDATLDVLRSLGEEARVIGEVVNGKGATLV
jgi:phosphoribosylformylglycinamidine cyclo-ligase